MRIIQIVVARRYTNPLRWMKLFDDRKNPFILAAIKMTRNTRIKRKKRNIAEIAGIEPAAKKKPVSLRESQNHVLSKTWIYPGQA